MPSGYEILWEMTQLTAQKGARHCPVQPTRVAGAKGGTTGNYCPVNQVPLRVPLFCMAGVVCFYL